ncbi:hypothetical protein FHS27_000476 [Rhodopirellula rubra]|uniref:Uncharacterized protein n=1 Tax=Aporhodopirellula rubra TaxID=980271 RepID=A0A7W5H2Z3_9BACT|nr:hypothetical protein [Aporhodopirellula rubra]
MARKIKRSLKFSVEFLKMPGTKSFVANYSYEVWRVCTLYRHFYGDLPPRVSHQSRIN